MTGSTSVPLRTAAIGWHGKLPLQGDFLGRGLPAGWLQTWDDWVQRALSAAGGLIGPALLRERLLAMPPWQCLIDRPEDRDWPAVCALVMPSTDRVGRVHPCVLAEALAPADVRRLTPALLHARARGASAWLRPALAQGAAAVDAGAARWMATPWRRTASLPSEDGGSAAGIAPPVGGSRWWRRMPEDDGFVGLDQPWPPRESLLLEWLAVPD